MTNDHVLMMKECRNPNDAAHSLPFSSFEHSGFVRRSWIRASSLLIQRSMKNPEGKIHIVQGDITKLDVDAIVNAANTTLLGGGGVDGAIHRAAGPELLADCRTRGGWCPGEAQITPGYRLPARFVMHTGGPIWAGGKHDEARTLANCYRNSLQLAVENEIKTMAFPAISCGAYGYPIN